MAGGTVEDGLKNKNKAIVLEAFNTLFNRRDYAAAESFWSPDYIQHSAHIEPGRDGLFNLISKDQGAIDHFLSSLSLAVAQSTRSTSICSLRRCLSEVSETQASETTMANMASTR
jgi:hypothetical protein